MDINTILKEDMVQALLKEFRLENASSDTQAYFLSRMGQNIVNRLTLETLRVLPEDKRPAFDELVGKGDAEAIQKFIYPYIPNFDQFVQEEVRKEVARTKGFLAEEEPTAV
ncbi:MAG: DUF5663 domain-containing protein [Patescibacteria group bacterium]